MKLKTIFVCNEEKDVEKKGITSIKKERVEPIKLNEVVKKKATRIKTGIGELDRVLGRWICCSVL